MPTPYSRGARAERELAKLLAEKFSIRAFRVAGSHEADLVILGIPIEVKKRKTIPETVKPAFFALLSDASVVAGPPDLFFSQADPMRVSKIITPALIMLIPPQGILALRAPRLGFALFMKWEDFVRLRSILGRLK
jgi:hypothetical protein